jgi:hypothetical protein
MKYPSADELREASWRVEEAAVRMRASALLIDELCKALRRYGRHDSSGMPDQPQMRCERTKLGGGACTCGLDDALALNEL